MVGSGVAHIFTREVLPVPKPTMLLIGNIHGRGVDTFILQARHRCKLSSPR